jgi:molybdenum cofactor cytidylyltransferase
MSSSRVAAIILAAGASSRMGQPKQLLAWNGRPLVRGAAEVALAAKLDPLLVVIGYAQAQVEEALAGLPLRLIANPDYAAGQSTSLRAGIDALGQAADAVVVLLGDQPFVTVAIVEQLVDEWHSSGALIVAPTYAGQRGNPVLFARAIFPELLTVQGDQGARTVLAADRARVRLVAFDDPRPLADIDTPEDYERLLNRQNAESRRQ